MSDVEVTAIGPLEFDVTVTDHGRTTSHRVTVPGELPGRLGGADPATLVRSSFAFLLEREPATSILPEFSLAVISRYFPEYIEQMTARLA